MADLSMFNIKKGGETQPGQVDLSMFGFGVADKPDINRQVLSQVQMGGTQFVDKGSVTERMTRLPGNVVDTFVPALKGFFKTTGSIIGEGLAYATSRNVREQFQAGQLDILPTITKTTQKDLALSTLAAGFEMATYKTFQAQMSGLILARMGIGGIQGLGFAISEGIAKDYDAEQIVSNAKLYGAFGAGAGILTPYFVPLLRTNLEKTPAASKATIKGIFNEARGGRLATQMTRIQRLSQPTVHLEKPKRLIVKAAKDEVQNIAITRIDRQLRQVQPPPKTATPQATANTAQIDAAVTGQGREIFTPIKHTDQAKRAYSMVADDPKQVMRMLYGIDPIPADTNINVLRSAAIDSFEKAGKKSHAQALRQLHKKSASFAGQDLGTFRLDKGSAGIMQTEAAIQEYRLAKAFRKVAGDSVEDSIKAGRKTIQTQSKAAAKQVTKTRYAKTAAQLLDELTC